MIGESAAASRYARKGVTGSGLRAKLDDNIVIATKKNGFTRFPMDSAFPAPAGSKRFQRTDSGSPMRDYGLASLSGENPISPSALGISGLAMKSLHVSPDR